MVPTTCGVGPLFLLRHFPIPVERDHSRRTYRWSVYGKSELLIRL